MNNSIILGSVTDPKACDARIAYARNPASYATADAPDTPLFR